MAFKCIAIGNRIMKDDAIGIKIVEEIKPKLMDANVTILISETDIDYAISEINDEDIVFIVDSSYFDIEPGTITITPISDHPSYKGPIYSQHQPNLIDVLSMYRKSVRGYVVGIEVHEISFSFELSDCLSQLFNHLCDEVYHLIIHKIKEFQDA